MFLLFNLQNIYIIFVEENENIQIFYTCVTYPSRLIDRLVVSQIVYGRKKGIHVFVDYHNNDDGYVDGILPSV